MAQIPYSKGGDDFTPWPEGTYDLRVKKIEQKVSKKEKPQLEITLEALEGPKDGKTMKAWYSLVPAATFRVDKLLDACGVERIDTGEKDENGKPILTFDDQDLLGRVFRAEIKHRDYEGKTQTDLKDEGRSPLAPPGQNGAAAAAPAQAATPATPSAAGAPVQARRPRPAPAS